MENKDIEALKAEKELEIKELKEELAFTKRLLESCRKTLKEEIDLKCSCFFYLVKTKQYNRWHKMRNSGKL